jgi:hypothetical protein
MGLDMYLTGKKYISDYSDEDKELVEFLSKAPIDKRLGRVSHLSFDALYWRKANAIHMWFVDNVQEGVDDCGEYLVSIDQLKELLKVCQEILKDKSKASILLPTASGFFYGSTDYDEWYSECIEHTVTRLEELVEVGSKSWVDFYYQSSW